MELIVRQAGQERTVLVEETSTGYVVTVDGKRYDVDVAAAGRTVRSLLIDGQQAEVGLHRRFDGRLDGRYEVVGPGGRQLLEVMEPLTLLAEKAHSSGIGATANQVPAYMPGRVVELLVAEGDRVEAGQGVLVLEAMKMENEIQAERAGVVERFFVANGQAVEGGDPLYEIS
jgi:biotin carboxyl carrier protein